MTHDLTFPDGVNKDTVDDDTPRCLCGKVMDSGLNRIFYGLRKKYPDAHIMLSKNGLRISLWFGLVWIRQWPGPLCLFPAHS